jgi:hypothetical protein
MRTSAFLVTAALAAGLVAVGPARSAPEVARVPDAELARVVGGTGAAIVGVSMPEDIVNSPAFTPSGTVSWNKPGGRCQYSCVSGPNPGGSNQGFTANAPAIIQVAGLGLATPILEVSGDGKLKARTAANFVVNSGGYDVYSANLGTKCIGGPRAGIACNATWVCGGGGGNGDCMVANQNNQTNTCTGTGQFTQCNADGPCGFTICAGGTNAGQVCNDSNDCPIAGGGTAACVPNQLQGLAHTCYALANCGFNGTCTDCTTNGAKETTALDTAGSDQIAHLYHKSNLHTIRARVLTPSASGAGPGFQMGVMDRVYRWVQGNATDGATQCATNCNGTIDRCVNGNPNCFLPPNCG